tara:strand:- start:1970 stop:2755 length:786 start_codon:yes stop_codon:yes gene_type:complete
MFSKLAENYQKKGFVSGIQIMSMSEASMHRCRLEYAENQVGSLHYKSKVHTILTSPLEIATNRKALDIVEAIIGPNILLFNVTYIIKEAQTQSHVSWHQDLTFWGLSHDCQVSMWIALSDADAVSGCMRMIPGSHLTGKLDHFITEDEDNVLLQGQTVDGVDESSSVNCPLKPGQASFHHGWTLHASMANKSDDRRIGLNVQYLAPHVKQTKHNLDTAMLVRGVDKYGHFGLDVGAKSDLDPTSLLKQKELEELYRKTAGS